MEKRLHIVLGWIGVCLILLTGCAEPEPPPVVPVSEPVQEADYVGDEACISCHEVLYESFHETGMGRSVSVFDPETAPERFDRGLPVYNAVSDHFYAAFVRNDTLFQREFRRDARGNVTYEQVYPAELVIGSGNATRSYLMNVNGYFTEMPLMWYIGGAFGT